jgi:hypothetical protein
VSIRRACRVLDVDTLTYRDKFRRPEQAGLERRIQEICQTRVRYDPADLRGVEAATAQQDADAAGLSEAARGPLCSHGAEGDLGDELCA